MPARGGVELNIVFAPPTSCHWTEGAPSAWQVLPEGNYYSETYCCYCCYETTVISESAPYHLVKGQQTRNLMSQVATPTICLATDMEDGQSCQIQVCYVDVGMWVWQIMGGPGTHCVCASKVLRHKKNDISAPPLGQEFGVPLVVIYKT